MTDKSHRGTRSSYNPLTSSSIRFIHDLLIDDLNHEGAGVGRHQGKVVFVEQALPGEVVDAAVVQQTSQIISAKVSKWITTSPSRVKPACQHAISCGGCQLQHMNADDQLSFKVAQVSKLMARHQLSFKEDPWQSPLVNATLGYRRKAKFAINKIGQLCYRMAGGKNWVVIESCPLLTTNLQTLVSQIQPKLLSGNIFQGIESIEFIDIGRTGFVLWAKAQLTKTVQTQWLSLAQELGVTLFAIKVVGRQTDVIYESELPLTYSIGRIQYQLMYHDFVQVHEAINQQMVDRVCEWLQPDAADKILDLFCGVGNFALSLAEKSSSVVGYELNFHSVNQAKFNAELNQLANAEFVCADLFDKHWRLPVGFNKVVIDPPREGAFELCQKIAHSKTIHQMVYVSCHPATLMRDLVVLTSAGFKIRKLCLAEQFPQSYHVEVLVLLTRSNSK